MSQVLQSFLKQSQGASKDMNLKNNLKSYSESYSTNAALATDQFISLSEARKMAKNRKWDAIQNLEKNLVEFETNFISRGGKVLWAEDAEQAFEEIHHILKRSHVKEVIKSKSMLTEEIDLNRKLEANGINVAETDLGEFIVQLSEEKPSHLISPAVHKSEKEIAELFSEKLGSEVDLDSSALTETARKALRQKYSAAGAAITGANFLIADTGSICITENEGNIRSAIAWPRIVISIVGIEKILPKIEDLELFWPLLSSHATGQKLSAYNTVFSGPKFGTEEEGPEEVYVVLIDNGRTKLLSDKKMKESLYCIKCAACLNVCPVFQNIGGQSYETAYPGPIGAVISPAIYGEDYLHLSHASTICGKCTEVCPVNIPIHDLLLKNRSDNNYNAGGIEKMAWKSWEMAMMNRKIMNQSSSAKNIMLKSFFRKSWGDQREFPKAKVSFNQAWKNKYG